MRYDRVIKLISMSYSADAIGQETGTPTARTIYANEFSIGAAEFYEAGRAGLKADREYQVRAIDYQDEGLLSVDGVEYQIIRVDRRGEWTRLVCQRNVGGQVAAVS